jgi:hypothetical protein
VFYFKNWDDGKCPDKQDTEMLIVVDLSRLRPALK